MYCDVNFRTKKALRDAVAAKEIVRVTNPNPINPTVKRDGEVSVEGPWYPRPHTWYARVTLQDGVIVRVR